MIYNRYKIVFAIVLAVAAGGCGGRNSKFVDAAGLDIPPPQSRPSSNSVDPPPCSGVPLEDAIAESNTVVIAKVVSFKESSLAGPAASFYLIRLLVERKLQGSPDESIIEATAGVRNVKGLSPERLVVGESYIVFLVSHKFGDIQIKKMVDRSK